MDRVQAGRRREGGSDRHGDRSAGRARRQREFAGPGSDCEAGKSLRVRRRALAVQGQESATVRAAESERGSRIDDVGRGCAGRSEIKQRGAAAQRRRSRGGAGLGQRERARAGLGQLAGAGGILEHAADRRVARTTHGQGLILQVERRAGKCDRAAGRAARSEVSIHEDAAAGGGGGAAGGRAGD